MPYEILMQEIKSLPQECLDDVAHYVEYVIYKHNKKPRVDTCDMSRYFGSMKTGRDGLEMQKEMRIEWD